MIPAADNHRLDRLLAALPKVLGDEDGRWLADRIRAQIAEAPDPSVSLSARSALVQDFARFYPGRCSRRAKDMARDAHRYAAVCWPRDRGEMTPPAHHWGKPEAVLFELHRNAERGAAKWPLAWRQLTDILQSAALATATASAPSSVHGMHGEGTMKPVEFDEMLRVKLPGPLLDAVSEAAAMEAETASHFVRRALISALRERGVDLRFNREAGRAA